MVSVHHLLNSDEFLYERTLGTLFLLLPKNYEQPKKNMIFEKNLEVIENDGDDEEDEEEENEDDNYSWSGTEKGFGWYNFEKKRRGYFLDRDYYHLKKKETCLFEDLYKKKENTNKNNKKSENQEDLNIEQNSYNNIVSSSRKDIQVYQNLKEFSEKYYLNSSKNKVIKDDYSYDIEKIIFDDNDFYSPYNKSAIFINQQRFVTPYDIHDTMVYFISNDYYWKSKKGQSLTEEINGLERDCEKYEDDFDNQTIKEYCHCIPFE